MTGTGSLDVEAPKAALASAGTKASDAEARIAASTLMIEKLRRALYRRRSERKASLVDQLLATATEDEFSAERAAPGSTAAVKGFIRRKPARNPFPAHWPRERVVVPAPTACVCCGLDRLSELGEDVIETSEVIPREWKAIRTVREKFTRRDCETISQPRAPFHELPRGWVGPDRLAKMLKRWNGFARFFDDGCICQTDNGAEWAPARYRARKKIMAVRRLRPRRCMGRSDVHFHRYRQARRGRPVSSAHRHPRSHRRPAANLSAQPPALELEGRPAASSGRITRGLRRRVSVRTL